MSRVFSFCLVIALAYSCSQRATTPLDRLPEIHSQALLVLTEDWSSPKGTLSLMRRQDGAWSQVGKVISVTVGRNGLGWGRGLYEALADSAFKREGDGKAPAGVFAVLGSFGYDSVPPEGTKIDYRQATARDYWVDDVDATDYNQWVHIPDSLPNAPKDYWNSFEQMLRDDHQYEIGLILGHNTTHIESGAGSAIFMHIQKSDGHPTSGCTAMAKEDLLQVIGWLDPAANPVAIQIPKESLDALTFKE